MNPVDGLKLHTRELRAAREAGHRAEHLAELASKCCCQVHQHAVHSVLGPESACGEGAVQPS